MEYRLDSNELMNTLAAWDEVIPRQRKDSFDCLRRHGIDLIGLQGIY